MIQAGDAGQSDIVSIRQDGQINAVKTKLTRLKQLNNDGVATQPAPRPPDDKEPDPDPW